jgi:dCMP deaminase
VLVLDDRILSTGFNGAPSKLAECSNVGCLMEYGHCIRTVHAEANALLEVGAAAVRGGVFATAYGPTQLHPAAVLYTTTSPCFACANLIIQCKIPRVVCGEKYADASHVVDKSTGPLELLRSCGIMVDWRAPPHAT